MTQKSHLTPTPTPVPKGALSIEDAIWALWDGSSTLALCAFDERGRLLRINERMLALMGRSGAETGQISLADLRMDLPEAGLHAWFERAVAEHQGFTDDAVLRHSLGHEIPVKQTYAVISEGEHRTLYCWSWDNSEERLLAGRAQEIASQNRVLADGILALSLCGSEDELLQVLLGRAGAVYPCLNWLYGEITDPAHPSEVEVKAFTPSKFKAVFTGMHVPILRSAFSHQLYEDRQVSYAGEGNGTLGLLNPQFVETFPLTGILGVPLVFEGKVMGALFATTFKGEPSLAPTEAQVSSLQNLARVGALALHRLRSQALLREEMARVSRLNDRLKSLQISLSEVAVQQDLSKVLRSLLELIQESTGISHWAISGLSDEATHLRFLASVGFPKEAALPPPITIGGPASAVSGRAVAEGRMVVVPDLSLDAACQPYLMYLTPYGLRSAFASPLRNREGELLGVLTGYHTELGEPTEEILSQTSLFSMLATLAIERFRLWSRLQKELGQRRESEALYKTLVEESLSGVYLIQNGIFIYANPPMREMFGYTETELSGKPASDLVAPHEKEQGRERLLDDVRLRGPGETQAVRYTFDAQHRDGRIFPVEVHGSLVEIGGKPAVLGVMLDITDRQRAQDQLASNVEQSRILAESAQALTLAKGEDSLMSALFEGATRLTGMPHWWHNQYDPATESSLSTHWTQGLEKYLSPAQIREPVTLLEFPFLRELHLEKSSSWIQVCEENPQFTPEYLARLPRRSLVGVPLLYEGEAVGVLLGGTLGDEGPRHLSENQFGALQSLAATAGLALSRLRDRAAMEVSEERYRQLFDRSTDAMLLADETGFVLGNEAAAQLFGIPRMAIVGKQVGDFSPEFQFGGERSRELAARYMKETFEGKVLIFPWQNVRADGTLIHTEIKVGLVRHGDRDLLQCILRDVTEAKRAQAKNEELQHQLFQAQKMESLGVLAGGIAHDFNNLLMGILGYAGLAKDYLEPGSPAVDHLKAIETASLRAADLTRQLLAYAGRGQFHVEYLDLSVHVEGMAHLLEMTLTKQATLQLDLGNGLPLIHGDPAQIQQVVMNLLINAGEAIEALDAKAGGGLIRLRTGLESLDANAIHGLMENALLKPGAYVLLEVSDTGLGMDAYTLAHIFEPFFTTKFTGRGLGLSAILGIVRGHGGGLSVSSAPERGTTFRIYLPAQMDISPAISPMVSKGPTPPATPNAWVLIVDDEDTVREVARETLLVAGFRVLEANSGFQALEMLDRHGAEVALVLLDMTMPEMSGETTFHEIRKHWPHLRVLLSSGFPESSVSSAFKEPGLAGFIQKPYGPKALQIKVREVLGQER